MLEKPNSAGLWAIDDDHWAFLRKGWGGIYADAWLGVCGAKSVTLGTKPVKALPTGNWRKLVPGEGERTCFKCDYKGPCTTCRPMPNEIVSAASLSEIADHILRIDAKLNEPGGKQLQEFVDLTAERDMYAVELAKGVKSLLARPADLNKRSQIVLTKEEVLATRNPYFDDSPEGLIWHAALSAVAERMGGGEEPVTLQWAKETFVQFDYGYSHQKFRLSNESHLYLCASPLGQDSWYWELCSGNGYLVRSVYTRADVLNLCQALGVPVKKGDE